MATVTATDFLVATGTPGLWVRLRNNVSGTDYYSTAVSDPQGSFTYSVPAGNYSLYTGTAATVPGTPNLRSANYQVAIRNGDDGAVNSLTATVSPYAPDVSGRPITATNSKAGGGASQNDSAITATMTITSSFSNTMEAIDAFAIYSSADVSANAKSVYAIRAQPQNTGVGRVTHLIGLKVNASVNSGGGTADQVFGLYVANQRTNWTPVAGTGSGLHFEGPNRDSGITWAGTSGSGQDSRLYATALDGADAMLNWELRSLTLGDQASHPNGVSYQKLSVGGTVLAVAVPAIGIYVNTTLVAQNNGDDLYGIYINPTFNDNAKTLVDHVGLHVAAGKASFDSVIPTPYQFFRIGGSLPAASGVAWATIITTTLTAQVNGDSLVGLRVNPTYADNAKTGVAHIAIDTLGGNLLMETIPAAAYALNLQYVSAASVPFMSLTNPLTAATANTGASGAPPAQVSGYLPFVIGGTTFKIPYYAN